MDDLGGVLSGAVCRQPLLHRLQDAVLDLPLQLRHLLHVGLQVLQPALHLPLILPDEMIPSSTHSQRRDKQVSAKTSTYRPRTVHLLSFWHTQSYTPYAILPLTRLGSGYATTFSLQGRNLSHESLLGVNPASGRAAAEKRLFC